MPDRATRSPRKADAYEAEQAIRAPILGDSAGSRAPTHSTRLDEPPLSPGHDPKMTLQTACRGHQNGSRCQWCPGPDTDPRGLSACLRCACVLVHDNAAAGRMRADSPAPMHARPGISGPLRARVWEWNLVRGASHAIQRRISLGAMRVPTRVRRSSPARAGASVMPTPDRAPAESNRGCEPVEPTRSRTKAGVCGKRVAALAHLRQSPARYLFGRTLSPDINEPAPSQSLLHQGNAVGTSTQTARRGSEMSLNPFFIRETL